MVRVLIKSVVFSIILAAFGGNAVASETVRVFVSIVPQKYFVQQIGKDLVDVQVMVQPGASPATYEPKPRQMADLARTKIYFSVGVPFEKVWLDKIAAVNPGMKVVHTDHGIHKLPMAAHHHHDDEDHEHHAHDDHEHADGEHHDEGEHHHHGEEGHGHEHAGLDPHIWLSPPLVKIQARTVLAALQEIDPAHQDVYAANFREFETSVDRLDAEMRAIFSGKKGLKFMVFHPAWGYFAHAYGLRQVPIEIEGKDPKPAQLQELIHHAREEGIKVVFVQPQFSTKSAGVVAKEIGGRVAFADPLAEDWAANLSHVAKQFRAALK